MNTIDRALLEQLDSGLDSLNLEISLDKKEKLISYIELLNKWNKAYNLSGIKNIQAMVTLHLLDSLVLLPFINQNNIADIGTGAGLPGMVLAICFPEKDFTLLDSNSKKTRFIFQSASLLNVKNIKVVHSRVEDYESKPQVDIVTSRAFASLYDFVTGCEHLLRADGRFLAMKGLQPIEEIEQLPPRFEVVTQQALTVPGVDAARHLIEIKVKTPSLKQ